MPASSTLAPAARAALAIASRLSRVCATGRPRSASLPPSSITTTCGWCVFSSAGRRARPPAVVSPLMLALTTSTANFSRWSFSDSSATQPPPRARPYSAERLSPTTSSLAGAAIAAGHDSAEQRATAAASHRLQCHRTKNANTRMSEPIIAVEHLTKRVTDSTGTLTILHDVGFTLHARESAAIVGASGSGKSTLLGLMAGLDVPSEGRVVIEGEDLFALDEDARAGLRARKLGFVFQSFQLLGNRTALENVMLPLELAGRRDARTAATEMLGRVGLSERLSHYPRVLSGGEQQRVALARAFVVRPKLLLADEPTGSLDFATGETVMQLMMELNREAGTTLVLVTHDAELAARCDEQLHIEAGRVSAAARTAAAA